MVAEETGQSTQEQASPFDAEAEVPITLGPNGPAMAAILAGALGVFTLGFLVALAAAAEGAKEWLAFQERVGPLSGKTTMAGVVWLVSWVVLHFIWRQRDVPFVAVAAVAAVLLVAGNLLMFPPIFERLEPA